MISETYVLLLDLYVCNERRGGALLSLRQLQLLYR